MSLGARRLHSGFARKQNARWELTHRAFCSGDVLLSHGLSPYYHRGCSVSLPCSEWERVGPLRYCHQRRELMVESYQQSVTAHLWRSSFCCQRTISYQLTTIS